MVRLESRICQGTDPNLTSSRYSENQAQEFTPGKEKWKQKAA